MINSHSHRNKYPGLVRHNISTFYHYFIIFQLHFNMKYQIVYNIVASQCLFDTNILIKYSSLFLQLSYKMNEQIFTLLEYKNVKQKIIIFYLNIEFKSINYIILQRRVLPQ